MLIQQLLMLGKIEKKWATCSCTIMLSLHHTAISCQAFLWSNVLQVYVFPSSKISAPTSSFKKDSRHMRKQSRRLNQQRKKSKDLCLPFVQHYFMIKDKKGQTRNSCSNEQHTRKHFLFIILGATGH